MATDFTTDVSSIKGSFNTTSIDMPLDIRTRVETEADIMSIPKPYIGMMIYVKDTGKRYEVLTLKDIKKGMTIIKNGAVNTYRELIIDLSNYATKDDISRINTDLEALKNVDLSSLHTHNNKNILDNITEVDINTWNAKSNFSGSYLDLSDLPEIPSKVSDLSNDLSFATESFVTNKIAEAKLEQSEIDLSGFATKDDIKNINLDLATNYATLTYVDEQISTHEHNVINDDEIIQEINKY